VTWTNDRIEHVSRFRLYPTSAQEVLLLEQRAHARYVGNLGLESGQHEGFRIVGAQALRVRQDNRRWSRTSSARPWLPGWSMSSRSSSPR
jgi:hypothetical protein